MRAVTVFVDWDAVKLGCVFALATYGGVQYTPDPPGVILPWAVPGAYQWKANDLVTVPEPVPCRGYQGLWTLPKDVERAVINQLPEGQR